MKLLKTMIISMVLINIIFLAGCQTQTNSAAKPAPISAVTVESSEIAESQESSSFKYNTKIHEILETDKYTNKFMNVTGRMEFQSNPEFDGYIVDEKGYKLLFKLAQKRGFNSQKSYIFYGEVIEANSTKYFQVTRGVYEVVTT